MVALYAIRVNICLPSANDPSLSKNIRNLYLGDLEGLIFKVFLNPQVATLLCSSARSKLYLVFRLSSWMVPYV